MGDDAPSFLGTGWQFPPGFSANGADVLLAAGVDDIEQSLQILLGTLPGERVMQEDFGCDLSGFLFEETGQGLCNGLGRLVREAILYYETRVRLETLEVTESDLTPGLLAIDLVYTVISTNSRYNMVYPFYLNESQPTP